MCRDVEATSRWYQELLGLVSDHGGPEYERLLSDGELVLQLHHAGTDPAAARSATPEAPVGNGALVWFGEVGDFDGVVERARGLGAPVVRDVHRNPPEGAATVPGTASSGSVTRRATPSWWPARTARPTNRRSKN